tara:strand:- start:56 stop:1675 length:1620 start_codon:yes stop_codon:yes gene_type:complete
MADKSFGVKELNVIGTGTPTIESPGGGNLNITAGITTFSGDVTLADVKKVRLGNTAEDFDIYYDNNAYLTTGSRGFVINSYNGSFAINVGASNNLKFGFSVVGIVCADDLIPEANGTRDLGLTGTRWKDLYLSDTANVGDTLKVGTGITANSDGINVTGIITATSFSGSGANLTGLTASQIPNLAASKITSGTFDAARIPTLNQDTTGNADTATQVKTQADSGTNATHYITFVDSNNASNTAEALKTRNSLTYNPSTFRLEGISQLNASTIECGTIKRGSSGGDILIATEGSFEFNVARDSVVQDLMPNNTGGAAQYDIGRDPNVVSVGSSDFRNICGQNFISANGKSRFNTGISTFPSGGFTYDAVLSVTGSTNNGGAQRNAAIKVDDVNLLDNWGIVIRSNSDPSLAMVFYDDDNDNCGRIQINNNSTDFVETSDYRIKENETLISDGITRLKQLKPYRFNFKKSPSITRDGFFAHEVQSVVPEAVTGTKDEVNSNGYMMVQGIDKSKLVPLLTAALQEAITEIETLKTKVAALEGS